MSSKWRYILGTTTIVLIAGGTIYAIKKSKDAKKSEESAITLDEARAIVERGNKNVRLVNLDHINDLADSREEEMYENSIEFDEMIEDIKDEASWNRSFMRDEDVVGDEELDMENIKAESRGTATVVAFMRDDAADNEGHVDEEEEEEETFSTLAEEDFRFVGDSGLNPKEDLDLQYDPNSVEAKHQYIRMELSDWSPTDYGYGVLLKLFDFPFVPQNDGDEMLRTQIIDFRVQFFGFSSRWVKDVTIADIILHYARAAEFNCGETMRYWVEYFFDFNGFDDNMPSHIIDELLKSHNSHTYFNEERQTFGLFGLTRESMDQAIKIANRNIDRSVTYEIEFNEFLKSCL